MDDSERLESYTTPEGKIWHCNANDPSEWFYEDSPDWESTKELHQPGRKGWKQLGTGRILWESPVCAVQPPPPPPRHTGPASHGPIADQGTSRYRSSTPAVVHQDLPQWLLTNWEKADEKQWTTILKDLLDVAQEVSPNRVQPLPSNQNGKDTSPADMCIQIANAVSQLVLSQLVRKLQSAHGAGIMQCWCLFVHARQLSQVDPKNLPGAHLVRFVATALVVVPERLRLEERPGTHKFECLVFELARKLTQPPTPTPILGGESAQASSMIANKEPNVSAWMNYTKNQTMKTKCPKLVVVTLQKNGQFKKVEVPVCTTVGELARKYGGTDSWEARRPDAGPAIFDNTTIYQLLEHDDVLQPPCSLNLDLAESTF